MKINIDLPEMYAIIISKWASVSRTLCTAESACEDAAEALHEEDESKSEKYSWCAKELSTLIPALDNLHYTTRSAIWAKEQFKGSRYRLKVKQIDVDRRKAQREHSDKIICDMMIDISEFGQEVPIIVKRENDKCILLDGLLRLTAIQKLGWLEIDAIETKFTV